VTVTVNPPKTPVTEGSNGLAAATMPNACKMPGPPAPFVPTPLPNIGKSANSPSGYSTTVQIEGKNVAIKGATFKSMGDVASKGTGGGIISANTEGATEFLSPGSMDVKIEGKNVHLLTDAVVNNCGSPANSATTPGVTQGAGSKLPVLTFDKKKFPRKTKNMQKKMGPSGQKKLTRRVGRSAIRGARRLALAGVKKATGGMSNDEFPFASSMQGAKCVRVRHSPRRSRMRRAVRCRLFIRRTTS
jgi:Domain of unknown function (DUF4150)